ncbi:haloalkane dehalogenase [Pseudoteredinibacter isoporae]|uniref:haloalkane dehalogenase n=1 Tax=Pseudoteredinibacter isoporae TaxID=570281 RepID=UPI0031034B14
MNKHYIDVQGKRIAYIDEGQGDPIVFLHGNPTSSYLWRDVIPQLAGKGRLIAPDLIGQGDSDKLSNEDAYGFNSAYEYLSGFMSALNLDRNITLVIHDWGSALGFHWAFQNQSAIKGIAYMEGIVKAVSWADWPESARGIFKGFRSEKGEDLILERNMFIEGVLPGSILRTLSEEEHNEYRRPFLNKEDRRPMLDWPRDIPIDGEPAHMVDVVSRYAAWMAENTLPKLFVNAEPGSILVGPQREFCRRWPNQQEVTVKGLHFIQEDSGREIGDAIANWLNAID